MSTSPGICEQCLACVRHIDSETQHDEDDGSRPGLGQGPFLDHHNSLSSFQTALQKFCIICTYLDSIWSPCSDIEAFQTRCQLFTRDTSELLLHFHHGDRERVLIHLMIVDDKLALRRHDESLVPEWTSDDKVLEAASSWMAYCATNHASCSKHYASRPQYPSRLVDLFPKDKPEGTFWKLVDDTAGLQGGYGSLSHRWGRGNLEPFKLTRDTYQSMCDGLPDSCLSGTYQDAMRVIRKLGLKYIWIDSLCISQDPGSLNITEEAHKMAQVYSRSSCNIAASTARQDTIFASRSPLLSSPPRTMLPATTHGLHKSYAVLLSKSWERSVLDTPLARRGWILQEQLLPSRVLYFGESQLSWSCLEGAFCELYPLDHITADFLPDGMYEGDFGSVRQHVGHAGTKSIAPANDDNDDSDDADDLDGRYVPEIDWTDLLALYGQRQLTGAEDKLLAIAGVIQLLSSTWGDTILGGLIVDQLPAGLLWIMDHISARLDGSSIQPSPVYRAPSWSWAYYDGPITYYQGSGASGVGRVREVAKVVRIETNVTQIKDIKIEDGRDMILFAASLPLYLLSPRRDSSQASRYCWMSFSSVTSTKPTQADCKGLSLMPSQFDVYDEDCWGDDMNGRVIFDLVEYLDLQEPLTAVILTSIVMPVLDESRNIYRFQGLVLRPHPARKEDAFERVGIFTATVTADTGVQPDTPMTKEWDLIDFALLEKDYASYTNYDFDSASFMREFRIA